MPEWRGNVAGFFQSIAFRVKQDGAEFQGGVIGDAELPVRGNTATGIGQIAVGVFGGGFTTSVISAVLGIAGFTTGIVLGVFFLGMFTPRVGQRAALVGLVTGLAGMTAIYFLTRLAWPWYALAGSTLTFGAGWLASVVWSRGDLRQDAALH